MPNILSVGWQGPIGGRLRIAAPREAAKVAQMLAYANVPFELDAALRTGTAGAALADALNQNVTISETFTAKRYTVDLIALGNAVSIPLVATNASGDVIGALSAMIPGGVLSHVIESGWSVSECRIISFELIKLAGMGVDPQARHKGVGSALISCFEHIYFRAGYSTLFGQYFERDNLRQFYRSADWRVLDAGQTVPIRVTGGTIHLGAPEDQRLILRARPTDWRPSRQETEEGVEEPSVPTEPARRLRWWRRG